MLRFQLPKSRSLRVLLLFACATFLTATSLYVYLDAEHRAAEQRLAFALAQLRTENALVKVGPTLSMQASPLVIVSVRGDELSPSGALALNDSEWVQGVQVDGPLTPAASAALERSFTDGGNGHWPRRRGKL